MLDKNLATNRQIHSPKKEATRSITYRLPETLVSELETESTQKGYFSKCPCKTNSRKIC